MTVLLALEDAERVRDLRRMKAVASGFLVATAAVFLATFAMPDTTATGYLCAAAEAGMVGGLADWFAVTALFRHPLGLPIPHTALIPTRKAQLGAQLGAFVTTNFLTPDNVVERLRDAHLVPSLAAQLATPDVADRLSREVAVAVAAAVNAIREEDVAALALDVARRDAASRSYAPLAGRLLADVTAGGAHRPLLDVVLPYLRTSMMGNRELLKAQLKDFGTKYGRSAGSSPPTAAPASSSTRRSRSWPRSRPTPSTSCAGCWTTAAQGRARPAARPGARPARRRHDAAGARRPGDR